MSQPTLKRKSILKTAFYNFHIKKISRNIGFLNQYQSVKTAVDKVILKNIFKMFGGRLACEGFKERCLLLTYSSL